MKRTITMAYALFAYLAFWLCAAYMVGFTANLFVPRGVDVGPAAGTMAALLGNFGLIALFGLQHSLMARESFKRAWRARLPQSLERSTYVLASALVLGLLYLGWRPLPQAVWAVDGSAALALWALFAAGWTIVIGSTFLISHAELFGLAQASGEGRAHTPAEAAFRTPWPYRIVRHPMMSGFVLALWATPQMSVGHLLFASAMSAYIVIGIRCEERALLRRFGDAYCRYRQHTPMLIPLPRVPQAFLRDRGAARP